MKPIIFLFIVSCSISVYAKALNRDEAIAMAKQMIEECKVQEGATDEDAQKLMNRKFPESHEGKCILACMNEKSGTVFYDAMQHFCNR